MGDKVKSKSLKFKLIIFAILSAIVVGIAINAIIKNNHNFIEIESKTEEKPKKIEGINKQQLEENETKNEKQEINKKQEQLEKKWKIGYDQFFKKEYEKAIETERQVIEEDTSFYKAYAVEGIALAYNGDFDNGMKQIDKALELKPDYGYARFNKALAYELFRHYDKAIEWYEKDLEVEKFEWSYYGIASVYGRKGDVSNTVKYLKLAIAINPNIKNTAKDESDFDKVRKYKEFIETID